MSQNHLKTNGFSTSQNPLKTKGFRMSQNHLKTNCFGTPQNHLETNGFRMLQNVMGGRTDSRRRSYRRIRGVRGGHRREFWILTGGGLLSRGTKKLTFYRRGFVLPSWVPTTVKRFDDLKRSVVMGTVYMRLRRKRFIALGTQQNVLTWWVFGVNPTTVERF